MGKEDIGGVALAFGAGIETLWNSKNRTGFINGVTQIGAALTSLATLSANPIANGRNIVVQTAAATTAMEIYLINMEKGKKYMQKTC